MNEQQRDTVAEALTRLIDADSQACRNEIDAAIRGWLYSDDDFDRAVAEESEADAVAFAVAAARAARLLGRL